MFTDESHARNPFDIDSSIFSDVSDSLLVNRFHQESEREAKALMDMGEHGRSLLYDDGKENKCSPDPSYGYRQDLV